MQLLMEEARQKTKIEVVAVAADRASARLGEAHLEKYCWLCAEFPVQQLATI